MIQHAFKELFPEREFKYCSKLRYSARFNDYNANIRLSGNELTINLSRKWKGVSRDIQLGLIQSLMAKLFKSTTRTMSMDLYEIFLKNAHISAPKTELEPLLLESFNRVNEKYFNGLIDTPNLRFGQNSRRKLGSYEYGSDTVTVTNLFRNAPAELIDYIVYHELLHKKHKFKTTNNRSIHHSSEFRSDEKQFDDKDIEKKLKNFLSKQRMRKFFNGWF
ncbi:M48 family metallopeptidase [Candidatus Woesearchaeota archaeon]|nr:M48 family metallopeptidase [Candidatus Woesearchaeota archaeon]